MNIFTYIFFCKKPYGTIQVQNTSSHIHAFHHRLKQYNVYFFENILFLLYGFAVPNFYDSLTLPVDMNFY